MQSVQKEVATLLSETPAMARGAHLDRAALEEEVDGVELRLAQRVVDHADACLQEVPQRVVSNFLEKRLQRIWRHLQPHHNTVWL